MESRICFVHVGDVYSVPYLRKYTSLLNESYDFIYWKRDQIDVQDGAANSFPMRYSPENSRLGKLLGYFKFRHHAINVLKTHDYEKVVVLCSHGAVLIGNVLRKKYKKKYIVDVRDYVFENNRIYYNFEEKIIKDSAYTIISSEGYKNFLPPYPYIILHNSPSLSHEQVEHVRMQLAKRERDREPLIVSYIGGVRFIEEDKRVLSFFKNDKRFFLRYIGIGSEKLIDFCKEEKIQNIEIKGKYHPDEALDYYGTTDFVLNLYGNHNPYLDYALSNKLYLAATFGLPILVSPDTYMEQISTKYGFGLSIDLNDEREKEKIIEWYKATDYHKILKEAQKFMKSVENDEQKFSSVIGKWLNMHDGATA